MNDSKLMLASNDWSSARAEARDGIQKNVSFLSTATSPIHLSNLTLLHPNQPNSNQLSNPSAHLSSIPIEGCEKRAAHPQYPIVPHNELSKSTSITQSTARPITYHQPAMNGLSLATTVPSYQNPQQTVTMEPFLSVALPHAGKTLPSTGAMGTISMQSNFNMGAPRTLSSATTHISALAPNGRSAFLPPTAVSQQFNHLVGTGVKTASASHNPLHQPPNTQRQVAMPIFSQLPGNTGLGTTAEQQSAMGLVNGGGIYAHQPHLHSTQQQRSDAIMPARPAAVPTVVQYQSNATGPGLAAIAKPYGQQNHGIPLPVSSNPLPLSTSGGTQLSSSSAASQSLVGSSGVPASMATRPRAMSYGHQPYSTHDHDVATMSLSAHYQQNTLYSMQSASTAHALESLPPAQIPHMGAQHAHQYGVNSTLSHYATVTATSTGYQQQQQLTPLSYHTANGSANPIPSAMAVSSAVESTSSVSLIAQNYRAIPSPQSGNGVQQASQQAPHTAHLTASSPHSTTNQHSFPPPSHPFSSFIEPNNHLVVDPSLSQPHRVQTASSGPTPMMPGTGAHHDQMAQYYAAQPFHQPLQGGYRSEDSNRTLATNPPHDRPATGTQRYTKPRASSGTPKSTASVQPQRRSGQRRASSASRSSPRSTSASVVSSTASTATSLRKSRKRSGSHHDPDPSFTPTSSALAHANPHASVPTTRTAAKTRGSTNTALVDSDTFDYGPLTYMPSHLFRAAIEIARANVATSLPDLRSVLNFPSRIGKMQQFTVIWLAPAPRSRLASRLDPVLESKGEDGEGKDDESHSDSDDDSPLLSSSYAVKRARSSYAYPSRLRYAPVGNGDGDKNSQDPASLRGNHPQYEEGVIRRDDAFRTPQNPNGNVVYVRKEHATPYTAEEKLYRVARWQEKRNMMLNLTDQQLTMAANISKYTVRKKFAEERPRMGGRFIKKSEAQRLALHNPPQSQTSSTESPVANNEEGTQPSSPSSEELSS